MIRHGETDFNRRGIVQGGGVDSDLNETGRRQAQAFFTSYCDTKFDSIYVSPLKRTHQTMQPWVEELGYSLCIEPGLTELSWGVLEGKAPTQEDTRNFLQLKQDWQDGKLDLAVEGGESPNQCWARLEKVMERFKSRYLGKTILVCSHGRTSRILLSVLSGRGLHLMEEFGHSNTGLNIIRLEESGNYVVEKLNDTRHLDGVKSI